MFEVVFLGTSASAPSIRRGLPSAIVMHKEYRFMVDCGEGTQRQLLRSGLGFRRLDRILLTHGHLDHILGLAGLASTFSRWEMIDKIEIYGGKWALDRVESLMGVVFGRYRPPIRVVLTDLEPGILLEDSSFALSAFPVTHRGPGNFGYVFQEKARRPVLVEKAAALGVPEGPERARHVVAARRPLGLVHQVDLEVRHVRSLTQVVVADHAVEGDRRGAGGSCHRTTGNVRSAE